MNNKIPWLIFVISILLVALPSCNSSNPVKPSKKNKPGNGHKFIYYVSPKGSDKQSGKSKDKAFKSLKHTLKVAKSGGEVRVLPGTYKEETTVEDAGYRQKLKITGFEGKPVIDGQRKLKIGFWFSKPKNIEVKNLEIKNFTDVGIGAEKGKNVTFRNLVVHNNGFNIQLKDWELEGYGIHIDVIKNYLVENNKVYRNGPNPKKFPDYLMGTGINTFGSKKGVIRGNKSYRNIGGGILVEDSTDILVEKNEIFENDLDATSDSWWDGGIWLDGGKNVVINNNNFHDNIGPGILISDEDNQKPSGYVLKNNVSFNNYFGVYIWNFGVNKWPKKSIISRSNNDFKNNKVKNIVIHNYDYDPKTLKAGKGKR